MNLDDETIDIFKSHFFNYWEQVKDVIDSDGWVYRNDVPFMLDGYFEMNTNTEVVIEKKYDGVWRGIRWSPKSLQSI